MTINIFNLVGSFTIQLVLVTIKNVTPSEYIVRIISRRVRFVESGPHCCRGMNRHYFRFRSSVSHDDEFLLMIGLLRSISLLLSSRSIEIYKLLYRYVLVNIFRFQVPKYQECLFSFRSLTHSVFESFFEENYKNVFKNTSFRKYLNTYLSARHISSITCTFCRILQGVR